MATSRFVTLPDTCLTDAQRRALLVLLGAALALLLVSWLMPPENVAYWVVLVLAPLVFAWAGYKAGGTEALRRVDRALSGTARARRPVWPPQHPSALSPDALQALEQAVLPVLIGQFSTALTRAPVPSVQPGRALLEAARATLRQPAPQAGEGTAGLLLHWMPRLIETTAQGRRDVGEACTLLLEAMQGKPDPAMAERLKALLSTPYRRKGGGA